ncbi:uncharacterized protein [Anabrus simplex]|uniref:uncharacterized protein isoform X2 n=1 Tax=Anabrus simplex TaxID=316456 RepID=UPI0035A2983C
MNQRISFVVLLLAVTVFMVSAHLKKKLCDCGLKKALAIDGCGCEKFVMKPALLAKPFCSLCDKDSKLLHSPPNIFYPPPPDNGVHKPVLDLEVVHPHASPVHSVHTGAVLDAHVTNHVGSYHNAKTLVADPVSLSIAYRNAQKRQIKEDAIAFGPIAIPKDGTVVKPALNIPEDGLLSFDKQVVELKTFGKHATVEEEAHAALHLAQEKNHLLQLDLEVEAPAHLSYADVGYLPEKHKPGPQFVVAHGGLDAHPVPPPHPLPAPHPLPPPKVSATISAEVTPVVHYGESSYQAAHAHAGYTQYNTNYATDHAAGAAHSATPYSTADVSQHSAPLDGYGYDAAAEYYDYEGKDYAYDHQGYAPAPPPPAYDHQGYAPAPPPLAYDHQGYAAPPTPAPQPTTPCKTSNKGGFVSRVALVAAG